MAYYHFASMNDGAAMDFSVCDRNRLATLNDFGCTFSV